MPPLDTRDRDPQWGAGFRISTEQREADRLRKEAAAREAYAADTRRIAAGAQGLAGEAGAPVDKLKQATRGPLPPSGYGEARRGVGPLLGLISRGEGTDRPDGYDIVYGYEKYKPPGMGKLSEMSVREVRALQDELKRRGGSRAVGKYQIMGETLDDLMKWMGLDGTERFTPLLQDEMAHVLLTRKRGYDAFLAGRMSSEQFQKNLADEWDSLPKAGRSGRITPSEVQAALARAQAAEKALNADIEEGRQPW